MKPKTALFWDRFTVYGVPFALPALAVLTGTLKPLQGVLAAVTLLTSLIIGEYLGNALWSSVRRSRAGIVYWGLFSVVVGSFCAIELAEPWGVESALLFGTSIAALFVIIACLEYRAAKSKHGHGRTGGE